MCIRDSAFGVYLKLLMFVIVSLTEGCAPLFIFVNVPEDGNDLIFIPTSSSGSV